MLKSPDRNSCKYRDLLLLSEITEIKQLQSQNYTAKKANLQNVWTERRDLQCKSPIFFTHTEIIRSKFTYFMLWQ